MQNEKNNSLPTQGGGAGGRETVARIIRSHCQWTPRPFDNEHEDSADRAADAIIAALQAAPSEGGEPVADAWSDLERLAKAAMPENWKAATPWGWVRNESYPEIIKHPNPYNKHVATFVSEADAAFAVAANPAVVLALIAAARPPAPDAIRGGE